ncbi:GIY-YIG nuclease family protein [Enterococcus sp. DIV0660C]|uniref:GIY-YIG nuclease family protein n=1 Tax=Enterococcus sp. DIV0660C TaxID=2230880 RepID=UPI001A8D1A14|nr:GIY-YIG nuclease family protein [Enterococcus sp. DIV0660C]MBO0432379.1 GIY-YIG nuclease family protein [Enterococcus sp. DIV0660C]
METKHYFYVLACKDNTFYGGYTTNLERRLAEHNNGTGAKYTRLRKRRPLQMIHAECFETRSEATKAEAAFKKLTRKQKELYLTTHLSVILPKDLTHKT